MRTCYSNRIQTQEDILDVKTAAAAAGQILFTRNDDLKIVAFSRVIHPLLPHSSIFKHSRLMANWLLVLSSFSFFIQFLRSLSSSV